MNKLITYPLTLSFAAATSYSLFVWTHLSSIPTDKITSSNSAPESFRSSKSITAVVNPNSYPSNSSSRSITLDLPKTLTDEVILARFVKGFFGGYVFAPEGLVLRALGWDMVSYSALNTTPVSLRIWHHFSLSRTSLPPLHSSIFGAFRVIDCHIEGSLASSAKARQSPSHSPSVTSYPTSNDRAGNSDGEDEDESHSYIDIAFGSEHGRLAGMHRFSVFRHPVSGNGKQVSERVSVRLEVSDTAFNPRAKGPLKPDVMMEFHMVYAMCLFRDGVRSVLQGVEEEEKE